MPMNDVALTSAMRSNLLTLQTTQSSLDTIQQRLATGRKINSALDGPQAFFAAQSLSNRAKDLARLLDGIGQNISTIKQADKGVTSLTKLVEQADAVASQALTAATDAAGAQAKIVGNKSLAGVSNIVSLAGVDSDGFRLTFALTDDEGNRVKFANAGNETDYFKTLAVSGGTVEQFIADINAITEYDTDAAVVEAKLNDAGQLELKSLTGGNLRVAFVNSDDGTATDADSTDLSLVTALGFSSQVQSFAAGNGDAGDSPFVEDAEVAITALAAPSLISSSLRIGSGSDIATASTKLTDLVGSTGIKLISGAAVSANVNDNKLQIRVNGGTAVELADLDITGGGTDTVDTSTTIQHVVDTINTDTKLKELVQASFDSTTGQLSIRAVSTDVKTIQLGLLLNEDDGAAGDISTLSANLGFGTGPISATLTSDGTTGETVSSFKSFLLGAAAGELARLEKDFNAIRTQIDQLVQDTGYAGINLLNGDSLTTIFNETRTTSLTTEGKTFTSAGLGVNEANFGSSTLIGTSLSELRSALSEVRNFGSTLANDLSVIQIRQEFTKETINTLNEGSDKLTLADQNEEGANMLALQTRQQLGVVSLSLASQAAQSVLRLF